jgi:Glutamine amidotransferase class-I
MHKGRALMFDAPAIHSDIVTRVPQGAVVTAWNAMSGVQAAEIRLLRGVFWGVQYHPEYGLQDVAALVRRYGQKLTGEGFFTTLTEVERYAAELLALEVDPRQGFQVNGHLSWRISRRKRGFQLADFLRVFMLPLVLLARMRPRAKRRTIAMFLAPCPLR